MSFKAFRYRIYPSKEQEAFLAKSFGCNRFVFNFFLNRRKQEYTNSKNNLNYYDLAKELTQLKQRQEFSWLNDVNSQMLQSSLRNIETAYTKFFTKQNKFPRFKSKKNEQCFKIPQAFSIEDGLLWIPKLKSGIKIRLHSPIGGKFVSCCIRKTCSGKYYASIQTELEIAKLPLSNNKVGLDLGIKHLITDSNGNKIDNLKAYKSKQKKLAYRSKQLSKKQKGSSNRNKARILLALIHEKISNIRKDYLHKLSHKIVSDNQVIICEDLSVIKMMKNHNLSKSIVDASWGELLRQLEYKSEWYGRTFYKIDKYFPSSKMCNQCNYVLQDMELKVREWECPKCHAKHDRDKNAANNILEQGLKDLGLWNVIPEKNSEKDSLKQKLGEALSVDRSENQETIA
jgi:putative transposase